MRTSGGASSVAPRFAKDARVRCLGLEVECTRSGMFLGVQKKDSFSRERLAWARARAWPRKGLPAVFMMLMYKSAGNT